MKETSLDSGACILKATVSVEFNISVSVIYIYLMYIVRISESWDGQYKENTKGSHPVKDRKTGTSYETFIDLINL